MGHFMTFSPLGDTFNVCIYVFEGSLPLPGLILKVRQAIS